MKETKKRRVMPPRPGSPERSQVAAARSGANLTAVAAGDIICVSGRSWTFYETGRSKMNGAHWRYFCMVTNQFDLL